jgi:hypothetical protein
MEDVVMSNVSGMNLEDFDPKDMEKFVSLVEIDASENSKLQFYKLSFLPALKIISFAGNNMKSVNLGQGFPNLQASHTYLKKEINVNAKRHRHSIFPTILSTRRKTWKFSGVCRVSET